MTDVIIPIHRGVDSLTRRAKTLRAMAKERHATAVRYLELGHRTRFLALLRDVDALEEEARRLETQRDGILMGRREVSAALEHLVAVMKAGRSA